MRQIKILDIVVFSLFILLVVGSILTAASDRSGEPYAEIETADETYVLPLAVDTAITISDPIGTTQIQIQNSAVRVVSSDCPDQICIAMGAVSKVSGWIACLPNRVFIRVISTGTPNDSEGVDAGAF